MRGKINTNIDLNKTENQRVHSITQNMAKPIIDEDSEISGATGAAALKDPHS